MFFAGLTIALALVAACAGEVRHRFYLLVAWRFELRKLRSERRESRHAPEALAINGHVYPVISVGTGFPESSEVNVYFDFLHVFVFWILLHGRRRGVTVPD